MSLKTELQGKIPGSELEKLSDRFDIIGDIAIVAIPSGMERYKPEISGAIMGGMHNIRTVLNKVSKLEGDRRVADLEILAGDSTETIHREYGFVYSIDLKKVFFNARLGFERKRIASQVKSGESVLVPFAGVGPFAIPPAAAGATVVAVEMNPFACTSLRQSCELNKVEDRVRIINADAAHIPEMIRCKFDRAIIPTPYGMDHFLEAVSPLVRKGGHLHFYTFKVKEQIPKLVKRYENMGFEVESYRRCGNVAPGVSRWAFDLKK
ncbi:class I SAM-dependent methyltransferase [Methanolobus halotolerans]|uniref:SAM-dependent methyltransferase n=1 Tax=Methanolobus halotolerans TaxID=2052935 RepID=A0A4E0Q4S4_9EURY|nr:class I SAM-dependent methyltransferase family protein [Methanolobus halotolerans]TGC08985.1 SAM-dependent methyltransferase [Methanolobus halotolerans]